MYKRISIVIGLGILVLVPMALGRAQAIAFSANLKRGSFGQGVLRLQEFLKTIPDVYPEGIVSGYFGALTEKAVMRFQAKYGIERVGAVGPKTRAKLNSLNALQNAPPQPESVPPKVSVPQKMQQEIKRDVPRNGAPRQPMAVSPAEQFAALEKELVEAQASGAYLAPAHYDRITRDLAALQSGRYSSGEIGRLRELALKLAPHVRDQQNVQKPAAATPPPPVVVSNGAPAQEKAAEGDKPPVLKNLGINFGPWDKTTNRAGAFLFAPAEGKLFLEYGAEVGSAEGGTKILPTFEYRTAADAEVIAAMDGIVTNVAYQERTQDYAVHIQPSQNSQWTLEHDHVRDLKIAKGNVVKAGDTLGKVGTLGGSLGRTEIMLWHASAARPLTYCPFKYFDPQLASAYQQKVSQHIKDWEEFKGNPNLYSEEKHILPGCAYESIVD